MSGRNSREEANGNGDGSALNGSSSVPASPVVPKAAAAAAAAADAPAAGIPKAVDDVITSDIGITTLLNRLKQSIASAKDFAAFLKKRSSLEEEQATGLKRLVKSQLESARRADAKSGTYAQQLSEMLKVHERMADNGLQFALSLHQMHEDLNDLSNNMDRGRKQQKHEGLDAEKKASDAEQAMQKAKARYDTLADQYDRARTGDTKGSRRLGLKGPKSAEQYESDLLSKTQAADAEYAERVRHAKGQRDHLLRTGRPQAVKALQDLIKECDSALTLQLQKYAAFNEKLLLGNGLAVSPLADKDAPLGQRSLRDLIHDIDNDRDFHAYVGSHSGKITRPSDILYEQHPTLAPKQQQPRAPSLSATSQPPPSSGALAVNTGSTSQPGSTNSRYSTQHSSQPPTASYGQPSTSSYGQAPTSSYGQSPSSAGGYGSSQQPPLPDPSISSPYRAQQQTPYSATSQQTPYNPSQAPGREYNSPPYPTHSSERAAPISPSNATSAVNSGYPPSQTTGSIAAAAATIPTTTSSPPPSQSTPTRPVFGLSLEHLFERDQSAVPLVVYQCMQAVDLFGLSVEGIYRLSGTASHVSQLRDAFNSNSPHLDFRNPANFYHDVNSVATLLKQFFRDLPDPLFTSRGYDGFIDAARLEDEGARRDALHQCINDLPDPNYATLRALVLHLHRVIVNERRTRMGSGNLAICFAPSLMGAHTGPKIADAGLQARVVDTILVNATAIFDED